MKELFEKFGKRTLAIPGGMVGLTLVNDAAKLGLPEHLMIFAVKVSIAWIIVETVRDCCRWICDSFGKRPVSAHLQEDKVGVPAKPPTTP